MGGTVLFSKILEIFMGIQSKPEQRKQSYHVVQINRNNKNNTAFSNSTVLKQQYHFHVTLVVVLWLVVYVATCIEFEEVLCDREHRCLLPLCILIPSTLFQLNIKIWLLSFLFHHTLDIQVMSEWLGKLNSSLWRQM